MSPAITRLGLACLLALSLPVSALAGGGEAWHPDLDPALELAAESGKDLLVDFTGSDWCSWCIKLDDEVFSHDEFLDYAGDTFVLVSLDYPKPNGEVWNAMPEDLRQRNQREQSALDVSGFPTILLMTPEGVSYASTGYRPGGADAYIEHLEELRNGDEREARLEQIALVEDASADAEARLETAYGLLGKVSTRYRSRLEDVIRELDPEDSRGVLAEPVFKAFMDEHFQVTEEPDWDVVHAGFDDLVDEMPSVAALADFHFYRGMVAIKSDHLAVAEAAALRLNELGAPERLVEHLKSQIDQARVDRAMQGDNQG